MIQDHLAVPFETEILGVTVTVERVDFNDGDEVVAFCRRGRERQANTGVESFSYPVPMKGGTQLQDAHVVNPVLFIPAPREDSIQRMLETFDRTKAVEVAMKRQHSELFFDRALNSVRRFEGAPPS